MQHPHSMLHAEFNSFKMKISKLLLSASIYTSALLVGLNYSVFSQPNFKVPIVSIDSIFKGSGFEGSQDFSKRLTNVVSNILDSLAMDSVMMYVPNYKSSMKVKSDYTVVAKLGLVGSRNKTLGFEGYVKDNLIFKSGSAFGCYGKTLTDISCFQFNPSLPDSTNYKMIKAYLFMGLRLIMSLVPMHNVLSPVNTENPIASFAVNKPLSAASNQDIEAAREIATIINNTLVFYQASYPSAIKRGFKNYNYYPNYRLPAEVAGAGNFTIEGTLSTKIDNFEIQFTFGGKDVNLLVPEELNTKISFNKKRFMNGDYSEAMYEITGVLYSFILMNTMFPAK